MATQSFFTVFPVSLPSHFLPTSFTYYLDQLISSVQKHALRSKTDKVEQKLPLTSVPSYLPSCLSLPFNSRFVSTFHLFLTSYFFLNPWEINVSGSGNKQGSALLNDVTRTCKTDECPFNLGPKKPLLPSLNIVFLRFYLHCFILSVGFLVLCSITLYE